MSDSDRLSLLERRGQENAESISELKSSFATVKIIAWLLGLAGVTIAGFVGFARHQITEMRDDTKVLQEQIAGLHTEIANLDDLAKKKR